MKHELTKTIKGIYVDGPYEYGCPVCNLKRVYSEPIEPEYVYCNGEDFGTKVETHVGVIEVSDFDVLKELNIVDTITIDDSNKESVSNLSEKGLILTDEQVYLSDDGKEFLNNI